MINYTFESSDTRKANTVAAMHNFDAEKNYQPTNLLLLL